LASDPVLTAMMLDRLLHHSTVSRSTASRAMGVGGMLSMLLRAMPAHLDTIRTTASERFADNVLKLIATALS
jgi:hypothetical protein